MSNSPTCQNRRNKNTGARLIADPGTFRVTERVRSAPMRSGTRPGCVPIPGVPEIDEIKGVRWGEI